MILYDGIERVKKVYAAKDEDTPQLALEEGCAFVYGMTGATAGAGAAVVAGAAIGTIICPGAGTAVGTIFGFFWGIKGYMEGAAWGQKLGNIHAKIYGVDQSAGQPKINSAVKTLYARLLQRGFSEKQAEEAAKLFNSGKLKEFQGYMKTLRKKYFTNKKLASLMDGADFTPAEKLEFFSCLCRDCGRQFGGTFPAGPDCPEGKYHHGPCCCAGAYGRVKSPLNMDKDTVYACINSVIRARYQKSEMNFDAMHKDNAAVYKRMQELAERENAESVQKEKMEIVRMMQKGETLIEAAELFNQIKALLLENDRKNLSEALVERLAKFTQSKISKGELDEIIEILKLASETALEGSYNKSQMDSAVTIYSNWKKTWESIKDTTFHEVYDGLGKGRLQTVKEKMLQLECLLNAQAPHSVKGEPACHTAPEYLALKNAVVRKQQEYQEALAKTKADAKKLMTDREPQAAIDLLTEFLKDWEHSPYARGIYSDMLSQAQLLLKRAEEAEKLGDQSCRSADYAAAIRHYQDSLGVRNSTAVENKLRKLLDKVPSAKPPVAEKPKPDRPAAGGYWQLVEENGSIGRECSPDEIYNDYYRDTVTGFASHLVITKMVRKGSQVYCKLEAQWQRPPERLYPGTTVELPVTINRLVDTGKYSCDMGVYFDLNDLECGGSAAGGDIGGVELKRTDPKSIHASVCWKVKEPSHKKAGEKLTIRACCSAGANICGKNRGMKYYYIWVPGK